jgi:hypothetical protein
MPGAPSPSPSRWHTAARRRPRLCTLGARPHGPQLYITNIMGAYCRRGVGATPHSVVAASSCKHCRRSVVENGSTGGRGVDAEIARKRPGGGPLPSYLRLSPKIPMPVATKPQTPGRRLAANPPPHSGLFVTHRPPCHRYRPNPDLVMRRIVASWGALNVMGQTNCCVWGDAGRKFNVFRK